MPNGWTDLYYDACDEYLAKAGGAGSRGGHVIGKTRSGKAIYASSHSDYKRPGTEVSRSKVYSNWHSNDHLDAANEHRHNKSAAINKINKLKHKGDEKRNASALKEARQERDTHMKAEHFHTTARAYSRGYN